ncbi:hypothetical protein CP97_10570 [Aurantiacibacter atlanticus]|uniref:Uncharacterized protein n=1 Tax=Aurantiacibacter atlanticus TaxID=1648404 RepID=A0A0H4VYX3_9SPHN|nr:hypothetical protein [Aurantiacibacter atlanticus]AKQ42373.2 hypothetical protein CP97_10570 [Aurantiacibacter atlanticus]MDF1834510.1 hypothetical protein [Alteraurantiacibacter sp. bin_em_oilr2.035]
MDEGWLELLATGLTFDLTGLSPHKAHPVPASVHSFACARDFDQSELEAITLSPGPHLASSGVIMFPVVRCLALLAAQLTQLSGVQAVAWHPARAISAPDYFRRGVFGWVDGGAFPGLGLTALVTNPDGSLQSEGLDIFTGQELLLPAEMCADRSQAAKIALRLLNWLVEHGRIGQTFAFTGPDGEPLVLEPQGETGFLHLWRGAT